MAADLYVYQLSSPSRAVAMLCKKAGIPVNIKVMDLFNREHHQESFLKMNPNHQVPVINDNGFCLYESRAIMRYVLAKFGEKREEVEKLYPSDPQGRGQVDMLLDRDLGCLYPTIRDYAFPQYCKLMYQRSQKQNGKVSDNIQESLEEGNLGAFDTEEGVKKVQAALTEFENCYGPRDTPYLTGSDITMADISIAASISFLEAAEFTDLSQWPRVEAWFMKMKDQGFYKDLELNHLFYELIGGTTEEQKRRPGE